MKLKTRESGMMIKVHVTIKPRYHRIIGYLIVMSSLHSVFELLLN